MDLNRYLATIANPLGETHSFTYSDGLLTEMIDPRDATSAFLYDALGLLIRDNDPVGGFKALSRTKPTNSYSVAISTALNRTNTYKAVKGS